MKFQVFFILLLLLTGCSQKQSTEISTENLNQDHLMSEGTATDPGSRLAWEYERLANPNTGLIPADIKRRELEFALTLPAHNYKAYNWDVRGPVNVGGRTRAIGIDELNENIWLAAGVSGGIWRSEDAGNTWTKVTDPLQSHSFTSLVQDTRPGHESTWYAGTGEHYAIVSQTTFQARYSGNGILKSTDNGITWSSLSSTISDSPHTYLVNGDMDFVWRIVTDPSDMTNDVVLAAVYNGVYYSNDGGDSWSQTLGFNSGGFSNPGSDNLDLIVTPSGVFYATLSSDGPDKGIYRSEDGLSWTNIKPSGFPSSYGRLTMAVNPLDENVIWFFGEANTGHGNGHGIWRYEYLSGDGSGTGGSWSDRSPQLPDVSCFVNAISAEIGKLSTQSSFDVHIAIHPTDTNTIFIGGTSIWRNRDGFTDDSTNTWIGGYQCDPLPYDDINWNLSYPNHHPDQHYLTFLPSDPSVLINVNDGGVYKTEDNLADSVNWIPLNNAYLTTQFYAIAIEQGIATSDIVIGGLQDNGTWFTNTSEFDSTWKYIGSGDGMYCAITNGAEYYLTSKQRGKLYLKQIDAAGNVLAHERIDPEGGPTTYSWCNSFKLDPNNDKRIFWNGRVRLWRLDDLTDITISGDRTNKEPSFWDEIIPSQVDPQASFITDIEMCAADSNKVWYGTANGWVYRLDNAYAIDSAEVKVNITGDNFPQNAYVSSISVNPYDSDQIVVTFANYEVPSVFITSNGGDDWTDISGNIEENVDGSGAGPAVFWCEYYVDGTIFIGTSTGLYTTSLPDGFNTVWSLEPGIGNIPVDHMDFRTYDGYFVVGTHGQGIFSTHLDVGYANLTEKEGSAWRVYPTVVRDQLTIESKENLNVRIYNLMGQEIIATNIQNTSQLNVNGFSKGTYIVILSNGEKHTSHKIIKQ